MFVRIVTTARPGARLLWMDDKQWQLRRCGSGQKMHYRLRQRHLFRIAHVTGVDQKRLCRSDQEIREWRFEGNAQVLPKNE
jgi:hypothetical protein